jgi:hypothetical protein
MATPPIVNLEKNYSSMRLISVCSIIASLIICVCSLGLVFYAFAVTGKQAYFVGQGGTTLAAQADSPENHTEYEMRNLVRTFATNMYAHDQYTYKTNLNTALPLIDVLGGRRLYADLKKQDLYNNYVKFGARTTVNVDSIVLDMSTLPIKGRLYMRQKGYIGDRQSQSLPLGCYFELANTNRSNANPFGMMLTRYDYFPYAPGVSEREREVLRSQAARDQAELQQAKAAADAAKAAAQ